MTYENLMAQARLRHRSARPGDGVAAMERDWRALREGLIDSGYRAHQRETIAAFSEHLSCGETTGYAVIPTAGGKTRVFMGLVASTREVLPDGSSRMPNTIVLVPTGTLIRQTLHELATHHPEVETGYLASKPVLDAFGGPIRRRVAPVTLMTYAQFMLLAEAGNIRPEDVDHLVMDEAHRGLSDMRQGVFSAFRESGCTVVSAFTATPAFDEFKALAGLLGAENEIIRVSHQRLRDEGILAPVVNYLLAVKIDGDLPSDRDKRLLLKRKAHVDEVLDFLDGHAGPNGHPLHDRIAVFYGADRGHARMFAAEYNRRLGSGGKRMVVLTGDDPPATIADAMRAIRAGTVTGVANARLLTEGWDLPAIGLVVGAPTGSLVDELQRGGRAMRRDPHADDASQTAYVLNTFYQVNGRIEGRPRHFAEALGENAALRLVEREAVHAADIDVSAYGDAAYLDSQSNEEQAEPGTTADAALPTDRTGRGEASQSTGREQPAAPGPDTPAPPPRAAAGPRKRSKGPFTTSHDIAKVTYYLRRRDGFPSKDEDWLSLGEAARRLKAYGRNPRIVAAWGELLAGHTDGRTLVDGREVRAEYRDCGNGSALCLHVDEMHWFAAKVGRIVLGGMPALKDGYLTRQQAAWETNQALDGQAFTAAWDRLVDGAQPGRRAVVDGETVEACYVKSGPSNVFAIHESALPWLRLRLGPKAQRRADARTVDWLSMAECTAALRTATQGNVFREAWDRMTDALEKGDTVCVGGTPVRMELRRAGWSVVPCLHRGDLPALAAYIGIDLVAARKSDDWLGADEAAPLFRIGNRTMREAFARMQAMPRTECPVPWRILRTNVGKAAYVHRDDLDALGRFVDVPVGGVPDKDVGWLGLTDVGTRFQRSIARSGCLGNLFKAFATQAHWRPAVIRVDGIDFTVAMRRAGPRPAVCVAATDLPAIAEWVAKASGLSRADARPADEDACLQADEREAAPAFSPA